MKWVMKAQFADRRLRERDYFFISTIPPAPSWRSLLQQFIDLDQWSFVVVSVTSSLAPYRVTLVGQFQYQYPHI